MLQFIVPILSGQREHQCLSFHLSTVQSLIQREENDASLHLSINKKQKLQPVMCSEQETGGQRKELPLVRWYGFYKWMVPRCGGKKKKKKIQLEVKWN